ncbi:MAG TPA: hypothetical protein VD994_09420 [Prosthecobacter sp.]|nr:hypothetical protein [Prosthecobacter sp.]
MSGFGIQFYAMPGEHASLFGSVLAADDFVLTEFTGQPPRSGKRVGPGYSLGAKAPSNLVITLGTPVEAEFEGAFLRENPDCLVLEIGGLSPVGLAQSSLWTLSADPSILRRWRSIVRRLTSRTSTGITAVSPTTGAECEARWLRFTLGAKEAYGAGIPLLPLAGNSILRIY